MFFNLNSKCLYQNVAYNLFLGLLGKVSLTSFVVFVICRFTFISIILTMQ